MLGFLKGDPVRKKEKKIASLYQQALQLQRNGKLREYAEVIAQVEKLKAEVEQIKTTSS